MLGDSIVVEAHHRKAAAAIVDLLLPAIEQTEKYSLTIAGESGSGKSETAMAIAEKLEQSGLRTTIFQQDDYFVYPPKTNDRTRRRDIGWVGPEEVHLDLLDSHLQSFLTGARTLEKPLVIYAEDRIDTESIDLGRTRVAIAEGTYTTLLNNVQTRVFIDRDYHETKKHRTSRQRDESELDAFIDRVLAIEHEIISSHKADAQMIIDSDYSLAGC